MTREEFNQELPQHEKWLEYWSVVQNQREEGDFILGYYYDKKERIWKMYVNTERGWSSIRGTFETEEEALDLLMKTIRLEARMTQRIQAMDEKRRRERAERQRLEQEAQHQK